MSAHTSPNTVLNALMNDNRLAPDTLALLLGVPVDTVAGLLQGDSPDTGLYRPLADALCVSELFIRALYSAPSAERDIALGSVLECGQAA